MKTKQVVIIRKDLNMSMGKIAAQASHACLLAVLNNGLHIDSRVGLPYSTLSEHRLKFSPNFYDQVILEKGLYINLTTDLQSFLDSGSKKIILGIDYEQDLLDIYNKAMQSELSCSLIKDAGLTEFNGVSTITCCCIGPHDEKIIDEITGHLKLL